MLLHRLMSVILFIPIVIGIETTEKEIKTNTTRNVIGTLLPKEANDSVTNFSLLSEGGSIVSHGSVSLEANVVESTSKSIKGRKGVNFTLEDSAEHKLENGKENKNVLPKITSPTTEKTVLTDKPSNKKIHGKPVQSTPANKKPLVLVYEAVPTPVADKTSFPLKAEVTKKASNPSSRPDLIMPVVITVLAVPMFAVLGYLAFKRGQDAWKNRHYKRMDFLLDGMYND